MDNSTLVLDKTTDIDGLAIRVAVRLNIKPHRVWYNASRAEFCVIGAAIDDDIMKLVAYIYRTQRGIELRFV